MGPAWVRCLSVASRLWSWRRTRGASGCPFQGCECGQCGQRGLREEPVTAITCVDQM